METETSKCPASGRTAKWCTDQTHNQCEAAAAQAAALDAQIQAVL